MSPRTEQRHVCDCGNLATVKQGGRKIWICERCHRLEREAYQQNVATQNRIRRNDQPDYSMPYPCVGGFAFIK